MLGDEINDILEKLDVDLTTLELRCKFWEIVIELGLSAKKRIDEIKRLKEEAKYNKDELLDNSLDNENKMSKLLTDLKSEKHDCIIF